MWTFEIKVKSCSDISQKHFTSCQGRAVCHSWDTPGLWFASSQAIALQQDSEDSWGLVASCNAGLVKTLSEEILTVLATTSIFFVLSSMKDHFAGILRAEGHSCFLSPLIYMRRKSHSWRKFRKWSIAFAILCLWSAPLDYRFWGFLWIEEILDFYGRSQAKWFLNVSY